ncbi:MAG: pyruvate ferredoxin oxidoreductase, partial [Candidatus Aenigmarchaeota archaeon]|nr:pyruvate ferredoxin oxidoreductase [Candidatus Aenigmarchaeota archaeon]
EGSRAAAEAVVLCRPALTVAYPITPQTHIVEDLAKFIADGKLKAEHMEVESEFSAISAVVGGSATGVRTFTATSSQGLALMHEVLFAASGMRLPIVMQVVNRALSAPINIWNDWQDSISARDSGWLQLYCETAQEVVDTTIQAYKIAEDKGVLLPVMVCMDGFFITHTLEPVEIPKQSTVDKFLPSYKSTHAYLDPEKPMTQGPFAFPKPYMELRKQLSDAIDDSDKIVKKVHDRFAKSFGHSYGNGLVDEYKNKGKKTAIITMGTLAGTVREAVDARDDISLVRIRSFRPFPKKDLKKALEKVDTVIILEKNIALGTGAGALYDEVRSTLYDEKTKKKILGVVCGIGGSEVTVDDVKNIAEISKKKKDGEVWWLMK